MQAGHATADDEEASANTVGHGRNIEEDRMTG
jgi:hypothetical protein